MAEEPALSPEEPEGPLTIAPASAITDLRRFRHRAMACVWEVFVAGEDPQYAGQAAHAAFQQVDRLEQELSSFIAHSDIARLNALRAGQTTRVSLETCECLEIAARVCADTGGAFDVTFRSAPADAEIVEQTPNEVPASAPITSAAGRLAITRRTRSVTVLADGVVVDLGGIGKGYAIDQAVAVLRDWSIAVALIHCGQSTVYALGSPPGEPGWTVAIRDPLAQEAVLGRVQLEDRALGGSGALLHGQHIIDPRTSQPAASALGAWTLAQTAAVADALSTAFMILSPAEVSAHCHAHTEASALMYVPAAKGTALHRFGDGFESIDTRRRKS